MVSTKEVDSWPQLTDDVPPRVATRVGAQKLRDRIYTDLRRRLVPAQRPGSATSSSGATSGLAPLGRTLLLSPLLLDGQRCCCSCRCSSQPAVAVCSRLERLGRFAHALRALRLWRRLEPAAASQTLRPLRHLTRYRIWCIYRTVAEAAVSSIHRGFHLPRPAWWFSLRQNSSSFWKMCNFGDKNERYQSYPLSQRCCVTNQDFEIWAWL